MCFYDVQKTALHFRLFHISMENLLRYVYSREERDAALNIAQEYSSMYSPR